jgi:hypothetical protein
MGHYTNFNKKKRRGYRIKKGHFFFTGLAIISGNLFGVREP